MSEFKGTEGPWTKHDKGGHPYPYICGPKEITEYGEDNFVLAYVTGMDAKHNINLIAAAPELLEALIACKTVLVGVSYTDYPVEDELTAARAAIAKALGGQK